MDACVDVIVILVHVGTIMLASGGTLSAVGAVLLTVVVELVALKSGLLAKFGELRPVSIPLVCPGRTAKLTVSGRISCSARLPITEMVVIIPIVTGGTYSHRGHGMEVLAP